MENLLFIAIVIVIILYWWENRKSNELVLYYCRSECKKTHVQLLDASVICQRSWLCKKHGGGGLQVGRLFSFEYSDDNESRHHGYIVLIGQQVVETGFPDRETFH